MNDTDLDLAKASLALFLGAMQGCEERIAAPNRVMLYCQSKHGDHFTVTYQQLLVLAGVSVEPS